MSRRTLVGSGVVVVAGLVVAAVVAAVRGLPAGDAFQLIALSFGVALALAGVGLVGLRRRASPVVVAMIPIAAVGVATLAAARAMFVSGHDLSALTVVIIGAGTAGLVGALGLADELQAARARSAEAAERERRIEQSRRELVAWVSHDLRTPLSGMRAMVEALEDGVVDQPADVSRYHQTMLREVDRLTALVDDLFELARIQSGALDLTMEPVPLHELVSDAVASASPLASAKGVEVAGDPTGSGIEVSASTPELVRVVRNLLDNAIRHTPPGGTVQVHVGRCDDHAEVAVVDECGGIADHDLDRVFDLAYRGDDARTPGDGGAGLGLAIAQGLARAHRGSVAVRNEGGGCRFTVRLPAS